MAADTSETTHSAHGRLTIRDLRRDESKPGTHWVRARYVWRPPPELVAGVPENFKLELDVLTGRDGVRRIVPKQTVATFIRHAAVGGVALLAARTSMDDETRFSYRMMLMLSQQAHRFREHLDRGFRRESDLYRSTGRRNGGDSSHILPEELGLYPRQHGPGWNPADVLDHGRRAASKSNPTTAELIRLGLLEAARRNPLDPNAISEAQAGSLVRMALFADPGNEPLAEAQFSEIQSRLLEAVQKQDRKPGAQFWKWLYDDLDNIVHAIAKRKTRGIRLNRMEVRRGILELVTQSHRYVGDCVHVQMQALAASLPTPLSPTEQSQFDAVYSRQKYLGGLPLVLLRDRFDFLKEAILDVWDEPNDHERTGVLLRMLDYYGQMARNKRESDRAAKSTSRYREETGRSGTTVSIDEQRDHLSKPDDPFQTLAAVLRECRRAKCQCPGTHGWSARIVGDDVNAEQVEIEDGCRVCGHVELVTYARETIAAVAHEMI